MLILELTGGIMKRFFSGLLKFFSFILVMLFVFAGSAYGGYLYITPSSTVSLKGSPSIKYTVNSFNRVLSVETDNEGDDIRYVLDGLKLNNMKISDALQSTLGQLAEEGYISRYENPGFVLSISDEDEQKAISLVEKLKNDVQEYLQVSGVLQNVNIETTVNVTKKAE